jgi:hypothetical protein
MPPIRLPAKTKTWVNAVGLGVWATGTGWIVVHFLVTPTDSLGLPNRVQETWWLKLHGALAFLALWTGGMLWSAHVRKAWGTRRHRWTGGTLFGAFLLLILTGYLLYYVGDDQARELISRSHWILGLVWPAAYLVHRLVKDRKDRHRHHRP